MMKSSLISSALVLGIGVTAHAQNATAGASPGKIRLTESYVQASCALKKALASHPDITEVSPEKMEEAFDRRTALEEQYKDALSRPYPPEMENYVPAPFEYADHLFTGFPCEEGLWTKAEMPAGFRCRLDRVVFRGYEETNPDMVRLAKRLHRYPVNGRRRSLRDVSSALAQAGFLTRTGKPFTAEAVSRMVRA
jgi:hypothetical protein